MLVTHHRLPNPYCAINCLANSVNFDGTNDYLRINSDMASNADGSQGVISFWFRLNTGTTVNHEIYSTQNQRVRIYKTSSYKMRVQLQAANGIDQFVFETISSFGPAVHTGYTHFLASWNTNLSAGNKVGAIYINDAPSVAIVSDASPAFNIDYTDTFHSIGGANSSYRYNGDLAGFYFDNRSILDLSIEANRRGFIASNGLPTGDLRYSRNSGWASGAEPIIYLKYPVASYGVNEGNGGNFSIIGALSHVMGPCDILSGILPIEGEPE